MPYDLVIDTSSRAAPRTQLVEVAPLLEVVDLSIEFRTNAGVVPAARDVSLSVTEGETVGLVGESGSGKTATALAILRLLPRSEQVTGAVKFLGEDLLRVSRRRINQVRGAQIGFVFQDPASTLNPVMTVGEQIAEVLRVHRRLGRRSAERETVALLKMVEIPDAARRSREYPHQFSGGMRQRATIAMALSCQPKLLIADEPTTALDVTIQAQILDLLDRLKDELHMALLLITHDFGVVAGSSDRISVMYAGRVVESGLVAEVFDRPAHPYTECLLGSIPDMGVPSR